MSPWQRVCILLPPAASTCHPLRQMLRLNYTGVNVQVFFSEVMTNLLCFVLNTSHEINVR